MAGHEWDWFQREELIGQISDIRVQNLQVERENVQKRTFTRWINLHLGKCTPPLKVRDLFIDIQDGKILMALLEVLSGQKLMHEYKSSTHRIFRLNNIAKALKFLEDSNVKLVSIDAAEIADGNSSLVLGLIWNIILFFQIKELTGNLNRNSSSSSLSSGPSGPESDTSQTSTPNAERSLSVTVKDQRKAIRALLTWVQRKTRKYGVAVQDFASSWRSGLAFLAIIKAIDSTLVDMKQALEKSARENLEDAFSIAQSRLGVPRLLEPEDIMVESPDEQSIVTYVAQFLEHFPELEGEDFTDPDKEFPIESTYVHIKDTPSEQEGKILILSEKEDNMYTVNHERSHPAPPKVHIPDTTERIHSETLPEKCNGKALGDSPEAFEEEPKRPTSLKITGSVSFESNSSWEVLSDKLIPGEGAIYDGTLKQNNELSPAALTDQKNSVDSFEDYSEELTRETSTEYDNETKSLSANTSSLSPSSWTSGILTDESINKLEETKSQASDLLPEDTSKHEDTHTYVLHLLNQEIVKPQENEHTNQSPVFETTETNHYLLNNSDLQSQDPSTQHETADDSHSDVPESPEDQDEVDEVDEVESSAEVLPSSSKVSVIPHDLFYYPHYNVPISAVLDAYVEPRLGDYDIGNDKSYSDSATDISHEKEIPAQKYKEDAPEEGLGNKLGDSASEVNTANIEEAKMDSNSHTNYSYEKEDILLTGKEKEIEKEEQKASTPQDSTISQHPEAEENHQDDMSEAVRTPEKSSKRKEKRKNVINDVQISKVGATTLSLDKLEEIADCQEFTRTSYSDSNIYLRKRLSNTSEKETSGESEREMTDVDEKLTVVRKKKDLEASETPAPTLQTLSAEQRELFYFIVFLWALVYCLLLFPQLVGNKP